MLINILSSDIMWVLIHSLLEYDQKTISYIRILRKNIVNRLIFYLIILIVFYHYLIVLVLNPTQTH